MIYYKIKFKYTVTEETDEAKLMRFWRKADSSYVGGQIFRVIILDRDETTIDAILMFSVSDYSLSSIKKRVISEFDETGETIKSINISKTPEEITVTEAISLIRCRTIDGAGGNAYRCSKRVATRWCNAEYLNDNFDLRFDEFVLPHKQLSFSKAKDEARGILADESFYEELERIYSPLNKRKFCGNPVNYLINAASRETAKNLVKLLTKALYSNKRLLSTRVAYVTELGDVSYDKAIKNLCENSYASVVVIECSDSNIKDDRFARGHERLSEDIYDILKEYSLQTAFILVDLGSKACKQAVGELIVKEDISFIEISEGKGDNSTGKKYLKTLLKENKVRYVKEDFVIPEQEVYSVNDIVTAYRNIKKNRIRNSLYKSYKEIKPLKIDAPVAVSNSYEKLHSMVGLTEIKSIIDQIVSSQKINKLRVEMGLDVTGISKHMIFTGNPGSAKTTVARLLTSILYEEKVIDRNRFVECGRQDLVGRYVGWTAKQVEEQFRKAMGGILFIDEAYSLVEKDGLYGDEARDIRDYHREIDYKYNALEAAWLVYQCRDVNVRQRHEAWNWIIRNMPDCKVSNGRIRTCFYNKSVHKVIAEYIELERGFIDSFMSESGYLYTYRHSCKIGDDGEVDIVNGEGVFTSAEKCIEHIIKEEDPKETKFAEISRRIPDEGEYYNRHGSIVINLSGEMIDVKIETKDDSESHLIDLECFFEDLWFAFPVPFKRGDIVFVSNRLGTEEPVVLTDIVIPPGWEREKYINMRLEHGGDTSDMNLHGYMMTDNSRYIGPFAEVWWNYMDVEYYRKELTGINRVLKIISSWLKGEFGDDLCLLLAGYHRILLEEVLAKTTPLMYTSEGLMSAGFPIKKN